METQIEDLRQRAADARRSADALAAKAEEVPQIEAEFQKLNRDYNIVKARHDELLARRESARMSRSRDDIGQEVQYRMIDPPIVPSEPIGPNRPLFLNVVAGVAIAVGLGLGLVLVILDTSFSTLADLRQYTQLPVLGAVTDTRANKKVGSVSNLALGVCLVSFIVLLAGLHVVEKAFGLGSLVSSALVDDLQRSASLIIQEALDWFSWIRASLPS
jgi:hypothetical protein